MGGNHIEWSKNMVGSDIALYPIATYRYWAHAGVGSESWPWRILKYTHFAASKSTHTTRNTLGDSKSNAQMI
jgi:hypothetical protein